MNKSVLVVLAVSMPLLLAACGEQDGKAPATQTAAAPAAPVNTVGQGIYNRTCAMCHASGAAGAPIPGNKTEWEPRIAQGIDVLYQHSIEGYTGDKGMMPPRGGSPNLTDDEMKAAVDFMVARSR